MAKSSGKVVSTVTYATGETADIRLLKNPMRFRAEVGDGDAREVFEDTDGEAVSAWALNALKRHSVIEWLPVIEVFLGDARYTGRWLYDHDLQYDAGEGLEMEYRRFYIGRTSKAWRQVPWDRYDPANPTNMADAITELSFRDAERYNFGKLSAHGFDGTLPYHTHSVDNDDFSWEENALTRERLIFHEKRGVLLAYDEATWAGVCEIAKTLRRARQRLIDIIERPSSLAAITTGIELLAIADAQLTNRSK